MSRNPIPEGNRKKRRPLVLVEWEDSLHGDVSWRRISDYDPEEPAVCWSCGWLMTDDGQKIVLAESFADLKQEDPQIAGLRVIPKSAVRRCLFLRPGAVRNLVPMGVRG